MAGPHRLPRTQYRGPNRYFLTVCCHARARWFEDPNAVAMVRAHLLRTATAHRMSIHAYCLMPDHLHVLCEGLDDTADLLEFVHAFKQRSAHEYIRQAGKRLWQRSFFDRHLRSDEDLLHVARYIYENPVRAGLVQRPHDYPHSGSATLPFPEILSAMG